MPNALITMDVSYMTQHTVGIDMLLTLFVKNVLCLSIPISLKDAHLLQPTTFRHAMQRAEYNEPLISALPYLSEDG